MALFFNLRKLEELACDDAHLFMLYLWYHYTKTPPKTHKHLKFTKPDLRGNSFILNPAPLFQRDSVDILFKIQYIKLAGRRDYLLYKQYKYKGLQTSYFPDLAYDAIKSNPLLEIKPTEILFKYER